MAALWILDRERGRERERQRREREKKNGGERKRRHECNFNWEIYSVVVQMLALINEAAFQQQQTLWTFRITARRNPLFLYSSLLLSLSLSLSLRSEEHTS